MDSLKLALYEVEKELNFLRNREEFYNAFTIELIKLGSAEVDEVLTKFKIKSDLDGLEFPRR